MTSAIGDVGKKLKINENFVYVRRWVLVVVSIIPALKNIHLKVFWSLKTFHLKLKELPSFWLSLNDSPTPHKFDNRPWDNFPSKAKSAKTHL
mgnify:CR=1 FL=1